VRVAANHQVAAKAAETSNARPTHSTVSSRRDSFTLRHKHVYAAADAPSAVAGRSWSCRRTIPLSVRNPPAIAGRAPPTGASPLAIEVTTGRLGVGPVTFPRHRSRWRRPGNGPPVASRGPDTRTPDRIPAPGVPLTHARAHLDPTPRYRVARYMSSTMDANTLGSRSKPPT
jgi:hypothetical protein